MILNAEKISLMSSRKKDVIISLQGNASLALHNRLTGLDEVICTLTQQTYTVGISLWQQRYCDANRQAQSFLAGQAPCAGKIILEYRHPSESQVAFTASQRFEIEGDVLEPITARMRPRYKTISASHPTRWSLTRSRST